MAHVMLPGASPKGTTLERTRYAADAIGEIINRMGRLGVRKDDIEVCMVGGGNVLKREDDTICKKNIQSVTSLLNERHIKIGARSVGGTKRRSVTFYIEDGSIFCKEGDGNDRLICKTNIATQEGS